MPDSFFKKECRYIKFLLCIALLFLSVNIKAQVRWDGEAGDNQWTTASNWAGNIIPASTDDVLLDNSLMAGDYTVSLPGSLSSITVRTIIILPTAGKVIQCILPASNIATPALSATGPGYGITIFNGGIFMNSSGAVSDAAIAVNDSFRIYSGGQYIHNTRSAHAAMVTVLSKQPGTEKGIFKFDVPGGGYTFASSSRVYGTLVLSADASGGSQVYATSAASPLTINGDFILETSVTVNLDITASTTIKGNYLQEGGVFNLASQSNNNIVYIKGDFIQTTGVITETSNGLPVIKLNGTSNQNIQVAGSIINSINLRINNNTGVSLLSPLSLPFDLSLINGIVNSHSFLITLQPGCNLQADSLSNNSFINGPLRKEGLSATANFLFPVGKSITQRWLALKNVSGSYTVEFLKANPNALATAVGAGIHHISSIEYWSVHADATPTPLAAIELSFDNVNSGGVTDMATLRVAQLEPGIWINKGNTATTGTAGSSGSVTSDPVSVFDAAVNYFSLASSDAFQNPLPLRLLSFNGSISGNDIVISWKIADPWQPAFFEIQSSSDGVHFVSISKANVLFNQSAYQYTDKRKLTGKQYYRLKAIEKDGSFFYTKALQVTVNYNLVESIRLWPSVVKNNASLFINAATGHKAQIDIHSMDGRIVQTMDVFVQAGSNSIELQLQTLTPGVYIIVVKTDDNKISFTRFVKLN